MRRLSLQPSLQFSATVFLRPLRLAQFLEPLTQFCRLPSSNDETLFFQFHVVYLCDQLLALVPCISMARGNAVATNSQSLPHNPLFDMESIQHDEANDLLKAAGLGPATKIDPKVDP